LFFAPTVILQAAPANGIGVKSAAIHNKASPKDLSY